jgi:four helix bundle protein
MKEENRLLEITFRFAVLIVNVYRYLVSEKKEFVLSKQLLRSGTSIGANVEEANAGQSRADFIAKLSISYKEAKETHYWIRLMSETEILSVKEAESLLIDLQEIINILQKSLKTAKNNL